jgi:LacI family transcriptional regulator
MLQELARLSVPYVLIDRELGNGDSPSAVLTDHAAGARTAADHLLALGHRRLGLLGAPQEIRPGRERAAGVRSACGAFPKAEALIASVPFTVQAGQIALDEMLDSKDPPTALLIGGNQLLPVALQVLHERNLDIPADISLVVFDGGPLTRLLSPAIANVSRALDLVGRKAAELLLRLLEGGEPEQILIPMTFDPGASCAPPKERTRRRRQARDNAK